jgi:hypothetical protein
MPSLQPPPYFAQVHREQELRWQQLESDEQLAAPWWQLFQQVQSPRHVISELLQNADDAGAKTVRVVVSPDELRVEHDGADFSSDDFSSLCQFGYSNKRRLHTIGFRGMGFKTAFSLGNEVFLATPTLRVRFASSRFTMPHWHDDLEPPSPGMTVRVSVPFEAPERYEAVAKNMEEWQRSPASVLFFRSITSLYLNDRLVRRLDLGPGPVPRSRRVRLESGSAREVLLFESEEARPPEDAVTEIRQERREPNFMVPPITVQVALGLEDPQRAYVVLPTGSVFPDLPFSFNAPFLQDPARYGIKDPALSPLNRWLLRQVGRVAAEALRGWLENGSLTEQERARAYRLLPASTAEHAGPISAIVLSEMASLLHGRPLVLTECGSLAEGPEVLVPPDLARNVWGPDPDAFRKIFVGDWKHLISTAVPADAQRRLTQWAGLKPLGTADLWKRLEELPTAPRPSTFGQLLELHTAVQREFAGRDYGADRRRRLALWPTQGGEGLRAAAHLVRLPEVPEPLRRFLSEYVRSLDPDWERFLEESSGPQTGAAQELLEQCGLARTTDQSQIISQVLARLEPDHPSYEKDIVRLAHAAAALDAQIPAQFPYLCRDGGVRPADRGLFSPASPLIERLLPTEWRVQKLLHERYDDLPEYCDARTWHAWLSSPRSRLLAVPLPSSIAISQYTRQSFEDTLARLGSKRTGEYRYRTSDFEIVDYDFHDDLWEHWHAAAQGDPEWWSRLVVELSRAWASLQPLSRIRARQYATTGRYEWIAVEPAPARWIRRLQELPCLPATDGRQHLPADLLILNDQTRPYLGAHPFVREDLFSEEAKEFLRLLGVRERFHDVNLPLKRIRALRQAEAPDALIGELQRWYEVLAQALITGTEEMRELVSHAFASEPLVLTEQGRWATTAEVCLSAGPDERDLLAPIHPALRHLGLWRALGVPETPTLEAALQWLRSLPQSSRLKEEHRNRVAKLLRKFGPAVWSECACWLSMDGAWTPVAWLEFGTTRRLVLHAEVAAKTADLTMLDPGVAEAPPFDALRLLHREVRFQLAAPVPASAQPTPHWLRVLAEHLSRVRWPDPATAASVRAVATQMARARWVELDSGALQVAPFLEGTQIGPAQAVGALWDRAGTETIYVAGRPAQRLNELVEELIQPLEARRAADAVRYCVLRDPGFIEDYFESHFELESWSGELLAASAAESEPEQVPASPWPEAGRDTPIGTAAPAAVELGGATVSPHLDYDTPEEWEEDEEPEPQPEPRRRRSRVLELFRQFAEERGFSWNESSGRFEHPDGAEIVPDADPFDWRELSPDGELVRRYAVARGRLPFPGLRVSEELWRELEAFPEASAIVASAGDRVVAIYATELREAVRAGRVVLVPAAYWLRTVET